MTDREALKEKVKELIAKGCGCDRYCQKNLGDCGCARDADAAIDLAFEEAVRMAQHISDEEAVRCRDALTEEDDEKALRHADIAGGAASVAAALRAYTSTGQERGELTTPEGEVSETP